MKLTNALKDLGSPIAYYPGLRKMTGSVTASILLCQLWYWRELSNKEWVWKTRQQITKETGLSEHEQRTAKDTLIKMGILEVRYRRMDHRNEFRINQEELDARWDEAMLREEKESEIEEEEEYIAEETESKTETTDSLFVPTKSMQYNNKKDISQMVKDLYINNPNIKKLNLKEEIEGKIKVRLRVNPTTEDWSRFIEYAANRQIKDNESFDKFLDWVIADGYNPKFYPPMKMMTMWPQAFIPENKTKEEEFFKPSKKEKQKDYAPMPKGIVTEKNT